MTLSALLRPAGCALFSALASPLFAADAAPNAGPAAAPETLSVCAKIGAAADRLLCYDKLAGRAPAPTPPADGQTGAPAPTSKLVGKDEPVPAQATAQGAPAAGPGITAPGATPAPGASLLSKYWELDPSDKRGIFNFTGYRANYVLPVHLTDHINRAPSSPTQAPAPRPNYRNIEAKFQLSLRSKVLQDVGLPGGDVWVAFTQQALWQIWNSADSKPFRNSDYEPELMYVVPTGDSLRQLPGGWTWRFTQLSLAHQSNGQSDPLSRSWNRVYGGLGFDRGDWSVVGRFHKRLGEDRATDNNPDLVSFRGRGDFLVSWNGGLHTASLLYRTTLKDGKYGAVQFDWTYPVFRNQPNGLRWYVQGFSGYGETLTDYNFRQNSIGFGVSFLQF